MINFVEKKFWAGYQSLTRPKYIFYVEFKITAIPICFDNYCYAIINLARNTCILVDVGDSEPVLEFLEREDILPNAILSTHKHW